MTTLRDAAQQALEALEGKRYTACGWRSDCDKAITALRAALAEDALQKFTDVSQEIEAALAEPVHEPVCEVIDGRGEVDWISFVPPAGTPLYTAPTQRKPLSEEDINRIDNSTHFHEASDWSLRFARAIERAHGIGGSDEA